MNPGLKAQIEDTDAAPVIAKKNLDVIADNDAYHTQEGVKAGLKVLIINRVPKVTIQDLDDKKFGVIIIVFFLECRINTQLN